MPAGARAFHSGNPGLTCGMPALPVAEIPDGCQRQIVACDTDAAENTIVTNPADKHPYLVLGNGRALRCGIAVGRAGFLWSGEAVIAGRRPWPSRTPPPEMIAHRPDLAQFRTGRPGGPTNPLGARAPILRRKIAVRARCRSR